MQKNWLIKNPNPQLQVAFSNALDIHPIVAQLLINRGIDTIEKARDFLFCDLSHLHDPFLLKDIDLAVARINKAKEKKEYVLIFGDYDVDGVSSSALLRNTLKKMGIHVINYIPHRMKEGYGLNHTIAQFAKEKNVGLLISVDCGISAVTQVDAINQQGIDVIIIDYHEPPEGKLSKACAIINPKRKDCPYPFKGLTSVGLVFKLSQALLGEVMEDQLDLVTMGTIADVAELIGENRIFVKEGLLRFNETKNKGLIALMDVAKIKGKKMRPYFVSFILGPRINATGRISSAEKSLNLLLSENLDEAYTLAQSLEEDNRSRQKTQGNIIEEALGIVEREVNFKDHRIIVISKEGWHRGVLGIVASRIMDMYYRPTIVISLEDDVGVGSARSIDGFHLFEALTHCSTLLENYGGHEHAAGLTIRKENLESFRHTINEFAKKNIDIENLIPTLELDCEIPLSDLNIDLIKTIETIEPFGEGNPPPRFCSRKLTVRGPVGVMGRDTLKFWVTDGKTTIQAVGFGMAKYYDLVVNTKEIDLAYSLSIDDWNKEPAVQIEIKDIKES